MTNNPITVSGIVEEFEEKFVDTNGTVAWEASYPRDWLRTKLTALLDHIEGRFQDNEDSDLYRVGEIRAIIRSIKGEI